MKNVTLGSPEIFYAGIKDEIKIEASPGSSTSAAFTYVNIAKLQNPK